MGGSGGGGERSKGGPASQRQGQEQKRELGVAGPKESGGGGRRRAGSKESIAGCSTAALSATSTTSAMGNGIKSPTGSLGSSASGNGAEEEELERLTRRRQKVEPRQRGFDSAAAETLRGTARNASSPNNENLRRRRSGPQRCQGASGSGGAGSGVVAAITQAPLRASGITSVSGSHCPANIGTGGKGSSASSDHRQGRAEMLSRLASQQRTVGKVLAKSLDGGALNKAKPLEAQASSSSFKSSSSSSSSSSSLVSPVESKGRALRVLERSTNKFQADHDCDDKPEGSLLISQSERSIRKRSQLTNINLFNHHKESLNKRSSKLLSPLKTTQKHLSTTTNQLFDINSRKKAAAAKMTDQAVVDKLEAGFAKLQAATPEQCHSLLKKYLSREVLDKLKTRKTAMGATLLDVAQSGFENLDSGVGIYAPDAESYTTFAELFNPIIEDYHGGFKATDKHPASDFGDLNTLVNVDPQNEFVISTRVRCGRSLQGYPFNPCLTEAQYKEMEQKVTSAFKEMEGDLAGTYYPLTGMTKETQQQLIDDHFLFKEGDRFLQAANACRYWPTGRGIYHNAAKTFLVWVNEEDHLRIISMQKGGDLKEVFGRLVMGAKAIEAKVPFSRDDRLGFLTFCPTNLGTTIRASVHIKLPKLAADRKKLEEVAGRYNLQVRGTSGEHTESIGGIYDISNKRRLGLTEYQAVREMQDGILELIKIEKSL